MELDIIYNRSSEKMDEVEDNSVHLIVTSPPYNVGKEYEEDLSISDYRKMIIKVMKECNRVLVDGGRACINIAEIKRQPCIPLDSYILLDMIDIGFLFRGTIVWNKGALGKHSTAWGSWKSPRNPILRGEHEYILVFSKNRQEREQCSRSTITSEEFKEYTKSVWTFQTASATKIGHPAPFPVELPYRCIQLYTYEHEIVLDPFIGSGQTAIACISTNRYYVGYEKNEKYFKLINERLKDHVKEETLW